MWLLSSSRWLTRRLTWCCLRNLSGLLLRSLLLCRLLLRCLLLHHLLLCCLLLRGLLSLCLRLLSLLLQDL